MNVNGNCCTDAAILPGRVPVTVLYIICPQDRVHAQQQVCEGHVWRGRLPALRMPGLRGGEADRGQQGESTRLNCKAADSFFYF